MGGGFNYNQSKQGSSSNSGLSGEEKTNLNRDAYGRSAQMGGAAQNAYNSDFGTFQGQTGQQMLGLDPSTGLPTQFGGYMQSVANSMFAKSSAGGSMRGQNTPENTNNVVGSAIRGLGATALPYVTQFAQQAAMLPEQTKASRLGYLQSASATDAALLGGTSNYSGSSLGFGAHGGVGAT